MKIKNWSMLAVAGIFFATWACGGPGQNSSLGGKSQKNVEGWKDADTYICVTAGAWDRTRYYCEDKKDLTDDDKKGKTAKSGLMLADDAKRAATVKATRDFLEKAIGAEIKSKTGVEDGALIADVIQSGVEGKSPTPTQLTINETPNFDVRITFEFKAKGLKALLAKATEDILKKNK